jgi:hypothetical protein
MKSPSLEKLVQQSREALLGHQTKFRSAELKAKAAASLNHEAKTKLKQAKKLAKFAKKQSKKERKKLVATRQAFEAARLELQQAETKLLKKLKKLRAKGTSPKAKLAKTTPGKVTGIGIANQQPKPTAARKTTQAVKSVPKAKPAVPAAAVSKLGLAATLPPSPIPPAPTS